ncbi:hypothetical protein TNIN_168961 [Trichonephila inaurata madagascariensis]|uniref:Uncharacterized protein n=1 Tax=Trichonephila inaurata madagascariensis TaxID=2747483 RepID=A0A8X7BYP9_9ARAC|nr:hypothetical protein TNIN_168961 [Trichonephila inaurata madagascariensis]
MTQRPKLVTPDVVFNILNAKRRVGHDFCHQSQGGALLWGPQVQDIRRNNTDPFCGWCMGHFGAGADIRPSAELAKRDCSPDRFLLYRLKDLLNQRQFILSLEPEECLLSLWAQRMPTLPAKPRENASPPAEPEKISPAEP